MFRREDYWCFMLGVFVIAGLVLFPIGLYLQFALPYGRSIICSFLACAPIAYGHRRDGSLSFGRLFLGLVIVALGVLYYAFSAGDFAFAIPGGLAGMAIVEASGWIGIVVGRATGLAGVINRIVETYLSPDTPFLPAMPTLSLRYLLERRISHFAIAAVALCVFIVVVVMTIMAGLVGEMKQKNHEFVGDCVVGTESLVGFPYYEEFMADLEASGLVAGLSPAVKNYALLNVVDHDLKQGVEILGIDPALHSRTTNFAQTLHFRAGQPEKAFQPLYEPNAPGIVWGIDMILPRDAQSQYHFGTRLPRLAVTLTCFPLNARGAPAGVGGKPSSQRFLYSDYSHTGIARVDGSLVYIPLEQAQFLCMSGTEKRVTAIHVLFRPGVSIADGTRQVAERWNQFRQAKADTPYADLLDTVTVQDWKRYRRAVIAPMEKEQVLLSLMFVLVGITTVFIVFVVFHMIVMHKRKDIGILKSVGASHLSVLTLFSSFAFCVGLIGSSVGVLVGWLFLARINQTEQWLFKHFGWQLWDRTIYAIGDIPNRVEPQMVAVVMGSAILACLIGALVPSYLAARLRPVETLHAVRT